MNSINLIRTFRTSGSGYLRRTTLTRTGGVLPILMRNARQSTTSSTSQETSPAHEEILISQRAKRPLSPHFTIYQPQLTWYMSFAHRVTGAGLAVGLYGVTTAYAFGGPDADTLVAAVSTLPPALKLAGKFGISYSFSYHYPDITENLIWAVGYL
ncbi:8691_t:CDS:2 [Funneliformis caledonium]|uniref:8691_t:CDS:1 n=1 Tax=Funneliformis caledonium TaxID=1117310 RepID=A0A9N8V6U3_9GLOM|nr:8691_t:CDS:2 [Funneliformis caledonium]